MYQFSLLVMCGLSVLAAAEETTCQTHQRNSRAEGSPVQWDINCKDDTGTYEPLQCTVQMPKWCVCYNDDEPITRPSRKTKTCECYLARDNALKDGETNCLPQCHKSGRFEKKQCCDAVMNDPCHCVDENTGERTDAPSGDTHIECS